MAVSVGLNGSVAQSGLPRELFPLPKLESESLYSSPFDTSDGQNFLVHVGRFSSTYREADITIRSLHRIIRSASEYDPR
jgi:hypothetical protein